ncbi:MAG: TatD family hydrolase [Thermodesulfobacteriota bacterium]
MTGNSVIGTALIDAHAHLNAVDHADRAIQAAHSAGVTRIVAVGMDLKSDRETLDLAARYPQTVLPAVGYHPWMIVPEAVDETLAFIQNNIRACVALGEVGLDYKVKVKKKLQQEVFEKVLMIAAETQKPVIVHSRFSYERCFEMVASAGIKRAVFHWYSGPLEILERIIQKGYYISATPALVYSRFHQAAVKQAPLERILAETDSPVEYQGITSEPARLIDTLVALSRVKARPLEEVAVGTVENTCRFFELRKSPDSFC